MQTRDVRGQKLPKNAKKSTWNFNDLLNAPFSQNGSKMHAKSLPKSMRKSLCFYRSSDEVKEGTGSKKIGQKVMPKSMQKHAK